MDIDYYFAREQVERVSARGAACEGARAAHQGLADSYRRLLDWHRACSAPRLQAAR